jgi:hypothetical protein
MTVRPEIDDENVERLGEIIDASVSVPLSSDELSINKQLQILTVAVYDEVREIRRANERDHRNDKKPTLIIDKHDYRSMGRDMDE